MSLRLAASGRLLNLEGVADLHPFTDGLQNPEASEAHFEFDGGTVPGVWMATSPQSWMQKIDWMNDFFSRDWFVL